MRDVLIIGVAVAAAILLGAWLYFSDGSAKQDMLPEAPFVVLDEGSNSGAVTERKNYRIKNQEELEALWLMVHGTGAPTSIDFGKNEVIAVFDGTHATGGYDISISAVDDSMPGARHVSILHTEPGASCITTDAITSPFQIIYLPKSAAPLTREDTTLVVDCQ